MISLWFHAYISDFQGLFLQLFYYLGHIIMFSIEPGNVSMFQDHEVCQSSAIILLFFTYY
jgi:hypothetical protein